MKKKVIKMKMWESEESNGMKILEYIRLCIKHNLRQFFDPKYHYDTKTGACSWVLQKGQKKNCPICVWIEQYNAH